MAADRPTGSLDFAQWLESQMKIHGLGLRDLERHTGIGHSSVSDYLAGISYPRLSSIRKLARLFNVEEGFILGLIPSKKGDPDLAEVWEYEGATLEGGAPIGIGTYHGTYRIRTMAERGHTFQLFRVVGNCMSPRIETGDHVVVDVSRAHDWRVEELVAVSHENTLLVKRVEGSREDPLLVADDGTEIQPDGDTRIIGVVVEIRKRP